MSSGPTYHELLVYYVGDSILIDVTCTDADGNVLDLTGMNMEWFLRSPDDVRLATLTLGDGIDIAVAGPESGKIEITLDAEITKNFAAGFYRDQLRVTTNTGIVATQMVGLIEFKQSLDAPTIWQASARMTVSVANDAASEVSAGMGG